jgi:hypothetical protein
MAPYFSEMNREKWLQFFIGESGENSDTYCIVVTTVYVCVEQLEHIVASMVPWQPTDHKLYSPDSRNAMHSCASV